MIKKHIFLIFTIALLVSPIDQTCSASTPCPPNAQCETNGYCVCQSGFIGSCSTPAKQTSTSPITAALTAGQTSLFYTIPTELGRYIEFAYTICQNNSQLAVTLTLWG